MSDPVIPDPEVGPLKVLDHDFDGQNIIYTVVLGHEFIVPEHMMEVPVLDENNEPQYEPVIDDAGNTVMVAQTTFESVPATVVGTAVVDDIIFAGDDPRWFKDGVRRPHDEVAAEQREIIKEVFAQRAAEAEREAQQTQAARVPMPGIGEDLQ